RGGGGRDLDRGLLVHRHGEHDSCGAGSAGAAASVVGMEALGYSVFATEIGFCAIAWGPHGLVAVTLPERDEAATRARVVELVPRAVPLPLNDAARRAQEGIVALLAGAADDLADVELDMRSVDDFPRAVYELARAMPPGRTRTYGDLAREIAPGDPVAPRAVGQWLGRNPWPVVVPCHRIVAASGGTGGFSAPGGVETKLKMLEL